jgi:hypothetical protein
MVVVGAGCPVGGSNVAARTSVKEIENGLISQIIAIAKRPKYRWKYLKNIALYLEAGTE